MPKGEHLQAYVLSDMLGLYDKYRREGKGRMEACELMSPILGHPADTLYRAIRRLRPTKPLAEAILQRGAARLAARVVRKANVAESIDILSRPNIGVLAPAKTQESNGGGGFFLSVKAGDLGAVNIGVVTGGVPTQPALPPAIREDEDYGSDEIANREARPESIERPEPEVAPAEVAQPEVKPEGRWNRGCRVGPGRSKKVQAAIAQAQERVQAAQRKRQESAAKRNRPSVESYQEHVRVQGTHGAADAGTVTSGVIITPETI